MSVPPYHPITTFTRTPGVPQIASYCIFTLQTVLYYAVILPLSDPSAPTIVCALLYSVSLAVLVVSTIVASACDPSDSVMMSNRNDPIETFEQFRLNYDGKMLFCDHCHSYVGEKARHCKACDRCTGGFDHHCMWINNCIGSKNYKSFFVMILAAFSNLLFYIAGLLLLTREATFDQFLGRFILSWISGGINSIFVLLLANLIALHIYLICKGISTYEFIIVQRQKEKPEAIVEDNQEQVTNQQLKITKNRNDTDNVIYIRSSKASHEQEPSESNHANSLQLENKEITQKSEAHESPQPDKEEAESGSSPSISQFFTRNKSLKLIMGKNEHYCPYRYKATPKQPYRELKVQSMFVKGSH